MQKNCDRYTNMDFGKYKGYDLGIVFVFDRPYLEWCRNNIENLHIRDWDELIAMNIIALPPLDWQTRHYIDPGARFGFNEFESFRELEEILNYKDDPDGVKLQELQPEEIMSPIEWELIYSNGGQNNGKAPTIIIVLHGVDREVYIIIDIRCFIYFAKRSNIEVMTGNDELGYLPDASKCKIGYSKKKDLIFSKKENCI